jgi:hypothetical protein
MGKIWTKQEIDFIRKYKTQMTNKQLAERLGCSESQLSYAIKKFRLTRTQKEYYDLMEFITGEKCIRPTYIPGLFWEKKRF